MEITVFPILFLYLKNISETSFADIYKILLLHALLGIILFLILCTILKNINKGAIVATLFIVVLSNYMLFEKGINLLIPNLKYWHILPLLLVICLHLSYFIIKKTKEENINNITVPLVIALSALILFNLITAVPTILAKVNTFTQANENTNYHSVEGQPNIYYMIFDECASFYVMEHYYNYSPSTFYDYLKNANFAISENSRNESGNTDSILTNCINIDYVVNSKMTAAEREQYRESPELYNLLKEEGYSLKGVGDTNWLNLESVNNNKKVERESIEGYNFNQLVINNSFVAPFLKYTGTDAAKLVLDTFEYMQDQKNINPDNSEMTLLYLCTPHQPFLFDANGNNVSPQNYDNWADDQYYLGQYQFIIKQIQKTIEILLKKDPNCIILLSSDHGPRFKEEIPYEDKIRILNAVYYQGESISEIQDQSIVNTLRIILNKRFDLDFPLVEVSDGNKK